MRSILKSHVALIALAVASLVFMLSYTSTDVVMNDQVYQKFLDDKYEDKYDEFKDLDIDLSEFEEELAAFDQDIEENSYGWDELYIDAIFIFVPLFIVAFGYSCTFLIIILFHKQLNVINYLSILKATLLGYLVFYTAEIVAAFYFLLFRTDYQMEDIRKFDAIFKLDFLFDKDSRSGWLWNIAAETSWVYIFFPLIVGLLLYLMFRNLGIWRLIGYSYLAYLIVLIFYHTVFWYLFDLF